MSRLGKSGGGGGLPAVIPSPTFTGISNIGGSSDLYLSRYAAKQLLVSGDGTGAAGANMGMVIGTASNNIAGLWSSGLATTFNSANAALFVDSSGNSALNAPTGATPTIGINGSAILTVAATKITTTLPIVAAAPVTETAATHSVAANTSYLIANRAGTITVTMPAAASFAGRQITIKTIQAQTVVSAASDVVPLVGGAASTPILAATAGKWARLVSDGTNWVIMEGN